MVSFSGKLWANYTFSLEKIPMAQTNKQQMLCSMKSIIEVLNYRQGFSQCIHTLEFGFKQTPNTSVDV